jgi:hypothetical protein
MTCENVERRLDRRAAVWCVKIWGKGSASPFPGYWKLNIPRFLTTEITTLSFLGTWNPWTLLTCSAMRTDRQATREPVDSNRKPFNQGDCFSLLSKLNKRGLQKHAIVVRICSWLKLRPIFNTALPSSTEYNLCCDRYHLASAFPSFGIPDELKFFSSPRSTLTLPSRRNTSSNFSIYTYLLHGAESFLRS